MSIIRTISIQGFKSIVDQEVELGRLNILIGTNGSGKSNFLEAIAMLSASIEGGIDYDRLARRGSRLSSPEIFRNSFRNKSRRSTFALKAKADDFTYRISVNALNNFTYHAESLKDKNEKTLCGRSNNGATLAGVGIKIPEREKSIIPIYRASKKSILQLSSIEKFAIYSPSYPILRGASSDNSNKAPLGLYGGRLADALSEVIQIIGKSSENNDELYRFFKLLDWFQSIGVVSSVNSKLVSEHVSLGRKVVRYKDKFMMANFNELYAYDEPVNNSV